MPNGLAIATVDVSFPLLAPDGSAAAPSYSFASDTDTGMWLNAPNSLAFSSGGVPYLVAAAGYVGVRAELRVGAFAGDSTNFVLDQPNAVIARMTGGNVYCLALMNDGSGNPLTVLSLDCGFGWNSNNFLANNTSMDLVLRRDAADTLAQRRSTNAQAFLVYGTYTDASNYTRVRLRDGVNVGLLCEKAGTGGNRTLYLGGDASSDVRMYPGGVDVFQFTTAGMIAGTDNTYDIGDATHRVRTLWSPILQGGSNAAHMRLDLGGLSALEATFVYNGVNVMTVDNGASFRVASTGLIGFTSAASTIAADAAFARLAAASLRQGLAPSATPVAQVFTIGEASRPGTDLNVAGANGSIRSGLGTGNAAGSSLLFLTPDPIASSTVAQTYTQRLSLSALGATFDIPDQTFRINGQVSGAGASAGSLTNAPAAGNPNFWLPINVGGTVYYFPGW